MKNILLTGNPGVGKTTLIQKILHEVEGMAGGFYTQEMRENSRRTGFEIVTFTGKRGVLASISFKSPHRVGKYGVDVPGFDELAVQELQRALQQDDLIVIDEIGKMELFSKIFREMVRESLDSEKRLLATITKSRNAFVDNIKKRSDVQLITVTESNRNSLVSDLVNMINIEFMEKCKSTDDRKT
ncbi:NTPase [candidate division KSB1 bacterium]|nr:NTPase [candidate division KSB1 bacterium]NIR68585.1 NTPase [candidate division KSB1 bacterium]NIS25422.1 NTPase [candidate division KSB1 bacterium]NIT72314.1 NTPase [candidate division KSB1 bacterium]NIU26098.1 NTPase [candidate division KSB1 bacterium]